VLQSRKPNLNAEEYMLKIVFFGLALILIALPFTLIAAQNPGASVRNLDSSFSGTCDSFSLSCESSNKFATRTIVLNDESIPLMQIENRSQAFDRQNTIYWLKEDNKTLFLPPEGTVWEVQTLSAEILEWGIEPVNFTFEFYLGGQVIMTQLNQESIDE